MPAHNGTETVLIAEDDQLLRDLSRRILIRHGYTVLDAADGAEALRLSQRVDCPIHLLLTDVVMPRMGGKELADQLTRERDDIRVLYMSGYTDDTIVHCADGEPSAGFLQKPFTPHNLIEKVREVLDR